MTALSLGIASVWIAGFWALSRETDDTWSITLIGMVASLIATGLAFGSVWPAMLAAYPGDSYWTLGWGGRIGVALISIISLALFFSLLAIKTKIILRWKRQATGTAWALIDIALGLGAFAIAFSVSPQAYYTFYQFIFPDLPRQWVIKGWIDADRLKVIAQMNESGALADHVAGIGLWAIVPFTLWLHLRFWWRGGGNVGTR